MNATIGQKQRYRLPICVLLALLGLACVARPAAAREQRTVVVDGVTRTFMVDPGKDAATAPSPLVFVFHGAGSSATQAIGFGIANAWPQATVVYPQGLNNRNPIPDASGLGWQLMPGDYGDQDLHFVDAMLADLASAYRVDARRVYATGFSIGGFFTWVLLAARPERFAAFAAIAGYDPGDFLWATVPRPALYMSGDKDDVNPGDIAEWTREQLLRLNGCADQSVEWLPGTLLSQTCASGQPVLYSRFHGFHEWPKTATPTVVSFCQGQALSANPSITSVAEVANSGEVVAGTGAFTFGGDGGPATAAQLASPRDVALDRAGHLFITDGVNQCIRQVNTEGIITTLAGLRIPSFKWLTRKDRPYFVPEPITTDREGDIYVADNLQHRVVRIGADGTIRAVAGRQPPDTTGIRFSGDGGPALQADLSFPHGLAVDGDGNLLIADTANHRVRQVDASGTIRTVAGTGIPGYSGDGGPALQAQLYEPWGLAIDQEGRLLIADAGNHCIRRVSREGAITTVAGDGTAGFAGDGGPATAARLSFPTHVAADSQGSLFIADTHNHRIGKVAPDGTITTLLGEGGTASTVPLASTGGLAIDRAGNLLLADTFRHVIRKFAGVAAPGLVAGAPLP
jgi:poly(3-hydroxybutyrate) depolymerase/DNA-binding beta-propeller fold protein YncE